MSATVEERARRTLGGSTDDIYRLVERLIAAHHPGRGTLLDVGCGSGRLWSYVAKHFDTYRGADVIAYDGFPKEGEFHKLDLDTGRVPLPDHSAEVVVAVETIEHLENPRALVRELTRLCKPGGWVIVTTPNQLSLLSKLSLALLNEYSHFRGSNYPAHITALLEIDLRRIAAECGLTDLHVSYSRLGRIPGTSRRYPGFLSRWFSRSLSDNVAIAARNTANR